MLILSLKLKIFKLKTFLIKAIASIRKKIFKRMFQQII